MSSNYPSAPFDLATNHGPIVSIAAWLLLTVSTLSVVTRLASKYAFSRGFHADDIVAIVAWLFNIGNVAAVSVESQSGLGQNMDGLDDGQLRRFAQSEYAAGILYILTLAAAKISIILLLRNISPNLTHTRINTALGSLISSWCVGSILALAFQCNLPRPWNSIDGDCHDRAALWRSVAVSNIVTDFALVALPVFMMRNLQMSLKKRLIVLSCFGSRGLDIIVSSVQLGFTQAFNNPNTTENLWPWTIISQVSICITIVTSCVPYLRPLLDTLPSGLYRSDELRRRGIDISYAYEITTEDSYKLQNSVSAGQKDEISAQNVVGKPRSTFDPATGTNDSANQGLWDVESQHSQSNIIKKTGEVSR